MKHLMPLSMLWVIPATPAHALESPIFVVTSINKDQISAIELTSMKRENDRVKAWIFSFYSVSGMPEMKGRKVDETRLLTEIDCKAETLKNIQASFYNKEDFISTHNLEYGAITYVSPDSAGAGILRWACGRGDAEKLVAFESAREVKASFYKFLADPSRK